MKINNPEFEKSAYSYEDYPRTQKPEFAFSGRSNVGKSSLINTLVNRKKMARISSTPGKTQCINFYNIDNKFYLVDLPGYGFARVPDKVKDEWAELIDDYLYNRRNLDGLIQLVDSRHKPTNEDQMMVDWLKETGLPTIVVATKVDKLKRSQRNKKENLIISTLDLARKDIEFTFFSAKTGEGKNRVMAFIQRLLEE